MNYRKSSHFVLGLLALFLLGSGMMSEPHQIVKSPQKPPRSTTRNDGLPPKAPNKWFHAERSFPNGTIPAAEWRQAQAAAKALRLEEQLQNSSKNIQDAGWTFRGPTNIGGRITSLAVDPTDENTVFAGCAEGGILRSTNGGSSWQAVFDDQSSLSVGAVAIDPSHPQTIYAGTGEVNPGGGSVAYGGTGLYRSTDGGDTWQLLGLELTGSIGRIVIDPTNSNRIFVAAMGDLWSPNNERGIYRTTNGGDTWELVHFIDDHTGCVDIVQRPDQPDVLFAAMWRRMRQPEAYDYGGSTCAVWRSNDGGDTWAVVNNGLPAAGSDSGRIGLSLSMGNPDRMYVVYADRTGYFDGLYRTSNGGGSWIRTSDNSLNSSFSSFGWWFGNVRAHPMDPGTLFLLGLNFYRSTNSGASYHSADGSMHVDHHALAFGSGSNPVIYAGNDGGIYRSDNGGTSWNFLGDQPIAQIYRMNLDRNIPGTMYLGAQDNGTYRSVNGATNNFIRLYGGDGFQPLVHPENSTQMWAQYQYGGLGYSGNNGNSFSGATGGIGGSDRIGWNAPHVQDPVNADRRYFGTQKVYRNSGNTNWTAISGDLTGGPHQNNNGQVRGTLTTLAVSVVDNDIIWTGSDDGRVNVFSGGFGGNWTDVSDGLPERWITSVRCDPFDRETAYVTVSGFRWGEDAGHVYRTTNLGSSWEAIDSNLPNAPVNEIFCDPLLEGHYYVASDLGVFRSTNSGLSWEAFSEDMPSVVVTTFEYLPETRQLFAGTFGRGVYFNSLPDPASATQPFDAGAGAGQLLAPWPSPTTAGSTFAFAARRDVDLQIEVYNLAGRRLWQQPLSIQAGQSSSVGWSGKDSQGRSLASGVYLVRAVEKGIVLGSAKVILQR